MSTPRQAGVDEEPVSEEAVVEYLRNHPDFFEKHVPLLAILRVPHPSGTAVSLIERQVTVLRQQNQQLRRKLMDMVQTARDNEELTGRMQQLSVALADATDLRDVLETLDRVLRDDFRADAIALCLIGAPVTLGAPTHVKSLAADDPGLVHFAKILDARRPVCGRLKRQQLDFLFGEAAAEIASGALLPLADTQTLGLLAIGSRDPHRFHPAMGTVFLRHMAELVSHSLRPHIG
ncbi:MAG: hypothetical protein B7Z66_02705 [Chromatiales bacterium 21-64-14]|nr:MAG: hypothetical protein B7Z66_02705 [Chromatiales bacterium 21-64-14]HQU14532.1 DUF484 family protein [Gammaproteobacteria bacterium]